ncbi:MAG: uroporphyrinogen-III C-methyltransferase [Burkholderiaceae bacterium]
MNPTPPPSDAGVATGSTAASSATWRLPRRWQPWLLGALMAGVLASLAVAFRAEQRVGAIEQELVRRQQDSAGRSDEARMLARQAQQGMLDASAKLALLEARVAEVAMQRGQLEDLIQSLSRSRDENLVVDIEAALRVAQQQAAITGSAEPLVATLKQSDERLARYAQPRLEGVRRAIARDLDAVKAASLADIGSLTLKLDEAVRLVDDLPLLSVAQPRRELAGRPALAASAALPATARRVAPLASTSASAPRLSWEPSSWSALAGSLTQQVWAEAKSLVRITRIEYPDAMLLEPEQAFFLRENLKLRLLNARLALLSRQFETAQSDLIGARTMIERYFDRSARRSVLAAELLTQVSAQSRQVRMPRPDDTLAALAAAAAGR